MMSEKKHVLLSGLAVWAAASGLFIALRFFFPDGNQSALGLLAFAVTLAIYRRRCRGRSIRTYIIVVVSSWWLGILNLTLSLILLPQHPFQVVSLLVRQFIAVVFLSGALGLGLAWLAGQLARARASGTEEQRTGTEPNNTSEDIAAGRGESST